MGYSFTNTAQTASETICDILHKKPIQEIFHGKHN
ncbi:hypothetical protein VP191E371_P0065 [Vibrio phage 191E37-1]|nr:hypothetical protein VP191E371_P0065 [Vibrio phage 191E37-1]CAH9012865.1 hypothetical protein VP115E341_P0069 [Vibrio phage 115E34-1]CAH9016637.1 hypothetical protein VP120E341_P0067 [Vibrio phage 120E34-1]